MVSWLFYMRNPLSQKQPCRYPPANKDWKSLPLDMLRSLSVKLNSLQVPSREGQ